MSDQPVSECVPVDGIDHGVYRISRAMITRITRAKATETRDLGEQGAYDLIDLSGVGTQAEIPGWFPFARRLYSDDERFNF